MYLGSLIQSGFGDPDKHVAYVDAKLTSDGTSLSVMVTPATGWGDANFGIYYNGQLAEIVYAPEGDTSRSVTFPIKTSGSKSIIVLRHGVDDSTDMSAVVRERYEASTSRRITHVWDWPTEIIGAVDEDNDDIDSLTSWSLDGYAIQNTQSTEKITRRRLTLSLSVSGSDATVTLSNDIGAVASGIDTFPGTVTLSEQNESGISGSVYVGATAVSDTGHLYIRYPASMSIMRDPTDPPTTQVAEVVFDGQDTTSWTENGDLAAGTYYYRLAPISDTGDTGTPTSSISKTIQSIPGAISDLAYSSGNAGATVLSFTGSDTVGATYNLYLQDIGDDYVDTSTVAATAIAGSTSITLPAVTGYPGTAYAIVRAVYGGIEEQGGTLIALEYDASGNYVEVRPNTPAIENVEITSGLTVSVSAVYPSVGALGTATQLQLFIREADGSYDFDAPDDTAALSTTDGVNYIETLSATATASGWYFVTVKSATASGLQSDGYAEEESVYLSDADMSAPVVTSYVSRG